MQRIEGGLFTNGDANTGRLATILTPEFLNAVQEELVNVVLSAGLSLNKNDNRQLIQAFRLMATSSLADGSIQGSKLADAAVTTEKLSDASITAAKLAAASMLAQMIQDGAICGPQLANDAVTNSKLADSQDFGDKTQDLVLDATKFEASLAKRFTAETVSTNASTDLEDTTVNTTEATESFALPTNYASNYTDILLVSAADNVSARSYTTNLIPIDLFDQTSSSGLKIPLLVTAGTQQNVSVVVYKSNNNLVYSRYSSSTTKSLTAQKIILINR